MHPDDGAATGGGGDCGEKRRGGNAKANLTFKGSGSYWSSQPKAQQYMLNGKKKPLGEKEYLPDVMHNFIVDFMTRHRAQLFYLYYSMSHVHGEILPTPDSAPDSKDL